MEEAGKNVFIAGKFKSIEGTLKPMIYIFSRCKKSLQTLYLSGLQAIFEKKLVEMAGVEPASPGLSAETSTRLAARLDFGAS